MDLDSDPIERLLTQYPTLKLTDDGQRVKCTMFGHEMPLKPDIIELYVGSRRYTRLLDSHMSPYYQKYKHLFADCTSKKRNRSQLYCKLTKHFVNRTQSHIKKHVEGANFVETYKRWLQHPWPLYGGTLTWPTMTTEAKSGTDADAEKQPAVHTDGMSQEMKPAAVGKAESADAAGSVADVLFGGRYYRSIVGEAKEADGDDEDEDDNGDSDDGDSCSDLYPENDFNEMDTGDSAEQSRNPLKRHVKQKKPKMFGLKAKMSRTDEDYVPV